jgi:hypothetical protein
MIIPNVLVTVILGAKRTVRTKAIIPAIIPNAPNE